MTRRQAWSFLARTKHVRVGGNLGERLRELRFLERARLVLVELGEDHDTSVSAVLSLTLKKRFMLKQNNTRVCKKNSAKFLKIHMNRECYDGNKCRSSKMLRFISFQNIQDVAENGHMLCHTGRPQISKPK